MPDINAGQDGETEPPETLSRPAKALWWLRAGDLRTGAAWEKAHAFCQMQEGDRAHDLVHGLAHWIEGDIANADYWYRRAGSRRVGADPQAEWRRLWSELGPRPPSAA